MPGSLWMLKGTMLQPEVQFFAQYFRSWGIKIKRKKNMVIFPKKFTGQWGNQYGNAQLKDQPEGMLLMFCK